MKYPSNVTIRQAVVAAATIVTIVGAALLKNKSVAPGQVGAQSPQAFSLNQWKRALVETKAALGSKNLPILGAGVAYFSTLAFFPMLAAGVAIAGFLISPAQIQQVTSGLSAYLPADIASLVTTQLHNAANEKTGSAIAGGIAIALALYGASGAISNLITATNVAYKRRESRGFITLRATSLLLTVGGLIAGFIIIGLLVTNGTTLAFLGLPGSAVTVLLALRWVLLIMVVTAALAVFYRYGPDRENPQWQWVSWGALLATVIWLIGTILFFIYIQNFANFSKSYSLFAGIIAMMAWLNLSAFIVLLGAEVNYRLERQTSADTTELKS